MRIEALHESAADGSLVRVRLHQASRGVLPPERDPPEQDPPEQDPAGRGAPPVTVSAVPASLAGKEGGIPVVVELMDAAIVDAGSKVAGPVVAVVADPVSKTAADPVVAAAPPLQTEAELATEVVGRVVARVTEVDVQ